jgi:hypothetical protein
MMPKRYNVLMSVVRMLVWLVFPMSICLHILSILLHLRTLPASFARWHLSLILAL